MVQTPEHVWQDLVNQVESVEDIDSNIEELVVKPKLGGVEVMVSPEYKYRSESETVQYNKQSGVLLKNIIEDVANSVIQPKSGNCYMSIDEAFVTADDICVYVCLNTEIRSTEPYSRLQYVLRNDGRLTDAEQLAYGSIDEFFYNSGSDVEQQGWELDGTLYKREDDDKSVKHFHPIKKGLQLDSLYFQWWKEIKEMVLDDFRIDSSACSDSSCFDLYMDKIEIDRVKTNAKFIAKIE